MSSKASFVSSSILAVAVLLWSAQAFAVTISFVGDSMQTGTGVGTTINLLSLQATTASSGVEWGTSPHNGVDQTGAAGFEAQTAQYHTRTIAEVTAGGIAPSNFALTFQVNESGRVQDLTLAAFTINFRSSLGALLASGTYNAPGGAQVLDGTGQGSAGYVFTVTFTLAEALAVFASGTNYVELVVPEGSPITNADDGPDNFSIAQLTFEEPPTPPGAVIPEPGTILLLGSGLGALGLLKRRHPRA